MSGNRACGVPLTLQFLPLGRRQAARFQAHVYENFCCRRSVTLPYPLPNSTRGERLVISSQFMVYLMFSIIWPCVFGFLYALAERLFPNVLVPDHVDE
jgi:hypothetical protein